MIILILRPCKRGVGERRRGRGQAGEMTQTMYEHMNKKKKELVKIHSKNQGIRYHFFKKA
jgi:hypothetical protein